MTDAATPGLKRRILDSFPLCLEPCQSRIITLLWLALILLPFHQFYYFRLEFTQWDLLLFTGILVFILGLRLVAELRRQFERMLTRLCTRKVVSEDDDWNQLLTNVEQQAGDWGRIGGVVAAIAMLAAFAVALWPDFLMQRVLLGVAETLGAYVAGTYLGRMASYGQFGWQLQKSSININLQPEHVDGVAGLKPIGDYFFYQATIAGLPAIFLAVWWFLFPIWPRDYSHWEEAYVALLSIAIVVEILAFLLPIWSFHRIMLSEKAQWLEKADRLSSEIVDLQSIQGSSLRDKSKKVTPEQLEEMRQRYWSIENMPTWPVDINTRKKFRLNSAFLLVPLVGDIAKRSVDWTKILSILKELST